MHSCVKGKKAPDALFCKTIAKGISTDPNLFLQEQSKEWGGAWGCDDDEARKRPVPFFRDSFFRVFRMKIP